ncbi:hypothetical protein LOD99_13744 [Oopsacas minuta]|uniref:Protein-tyrosine-phosphatase n=1 Tax=Oopsacas minuta TaxID=111878 RepID=A0AAV7KI55_9METZ|nr:hypothetical protein LOD99_13744 [Oopsacas minuta]
MKILIATLILQIILIHGQNNVLQCPRLRVFFEIDSSLSVTQSNFNDEIRLVRSLINGIRHSTGSEAGFIPFNSQVILSSLSALSTDLESQLSRLSALALSTENTSLTNALIYANESVFTEITMSTVPQNVLVLLTDDVDSTADDMELSALSASLTNDKATIVIVVAFENIINTAQLGLIASPAPGDVNLQLFPDSGTAADNFQNIFTDTGICNAVPLEAPINPRVALFESRSLRIEWTLPSSPVTAFRVCYTTNTNANLNNVCENSVDTGISSSSQSINNLTPFTVYRYTVFSINNNLELGSALQNAVTDQEGSDVPVRFITAQVLSFNSVTVTWEDPVLLGRNGVITEYEVCYLPVGREICEPLVIVNQAILTHTTTALMANTEYIVRITPLTSAADQPRGMANEESFTTPRFPQILLLTAEVISATEIVVEWARPVYSVLNYRLTATNGANVVTVLPLESYTNFTLNNLSPFTEYTIEIVAITSNGASLPSNNLTALTFEAAPTGTVQNLIANGANPTSIQVNFTEPPMDQWNGVLLSYVICVRAIQGTSCIRRVSVEYAPSVSIEIDGLVSDTPYNVSVIAINGVDIGPEIYTLTSTPAANIPPVFNLRGEQTGAREISLQWENPPEASDATLVGGIRVCYGMVGSDCQSQVDLAATETSTEITLPEPISPYFIAVSLVTPTGSRGEADTILVAIEIVEVSSLRADAVSANEIVIVWTAPIVPLDFTLLSYSVYVNPVGDSTSAIFLSVDSDTLTTVVEGLGPDTEYEVTVFPVILEDFFIRNQTRSATTFQAAPENAPATVCVDFALSTALRISWTEPIAPNGPVLAYEIMYEGTEVDTRGIRLINASINPMLFGTQMFTTLSGLEEGETYLINVRIIYYDGSRALSLQVQGTTLEDVPGSPVTDLVAITNDDSLLVTWLPPPLLYRNGLISSYDIICHYTDANGLNAYTINIVDGQETSARLYNLPVQTTCNITVTPYTLIGAGPSSDGVSAGTQEALNIGLLCNDFRISLSVITVFSAVLIVIIIVLAAVIIIGCLKNNKRDDLPPPGMELYAHPNAPKLP